MVSRNVVIGCRSCDDHMTLFPISEWSLETVVKEWETNPLKMLSDAGITLHHTICESKITCLSHAYHSLVTSLSHACHMFITVLSPACHMLVTCIANKLSMFVSFFYIQIIISLNVELINASQSLACHYDMQVTWMSCDIM